jgi:hypothetical protein
LVCDGTEGLATVLTGRDATIMAWQETGVTDPSSGFAEAGAALGAIQGSNAQLQQQVSAGQLKMNPDAANNAAKVYEEKARRVERLSLQASRLGRVGGLGTYRSGTELATKFDQKASNGSTGAADLMRRLADELRRKADLYRQAAKDYVATDERIGQDVERGTKR